MDDTEELLTIGAFARRVGLAPSALRFYDDCGVLRPARVDAVTGYRAATAGTSRGGTSMRRSTGGSGSWWRGGVRGPTSWRC
ncbi:MerR family DNA-binding transcriptional regulator [Streptomyces decoyicus]|uniref:MerR family DNA-binding transcriptional regulator n=1 Tax=Streptomyces decoyicus TaxID=249567 RepID=UPI003F4CB6A3